MIGGGVTLYVAGPGGGEEEDVSQVEMPTPGVVSAADCIPDGVSVPAPTPSDPSAPKFVPVNPDAGLSDAERLAKYERLREEFQLDYAAWVECVSTILDTVDLRSVPTYSITIDFANGQGSLVDAVAKAELVVLGKVIGFSPIARGGTLTTVAVDQTLKGSPESTVTYMQGSQISPAEDWSGITVSEAPNEGLLVPGDRAVLLLQHNDDVGYYVQNVTGWYRVVDGAVKANYFNEWGASVEGKTEAEFVEMIKAALQ